MYIVLYVKEHACKGLFSKWIDLIQATALKFSIARPTKSASKAQLLPKSNSFATVAATSQTIVYFITQAYSCLSKKKKNPFTFLFILKSANFWSTSLKPCIFGCFVNGPKIIFHTPVLAVFRKPTSLYKLLHCLLLTLHPLRHFDSLCLTPTPSLPLLLPGSPRVLHQLSAGSLLWAALVAHLPAWDSIFIFLLVLLVDV